MLKPGQRTTEFLLVALTAIGALAAALAGELSPRYAAIAAAVSTGAYAISRGIAKAGATLGPVPTIPAAPPPTNPPAQ